MAVATLSTCRDRLMATLRDANYGQADWTEVLNEHLRRTQERLWLEYEWPDLLAYASFQTNGNAARYALPAGVTLEGIRRVAQFRDGVTRLLDYGLPVEDRAATVDKTDWQERWLWVGADYPSTPMELWPPPNSQSDIWVAYQKALGPFSMDFHNSTLDATLIVLWAAADIAIARGAKDAEWRVTEAQRYQEALRARLAPSRRMTWTMSGVGVKGDWFTFRG